MRWVIAFLLLPFPLWAADCRDLSYAGADYTVCEVDLDQETLRLFLNDDETDEPFGSFTKVEKSLSHEGLSLGFAMNGGMYHSDRAPVGLYVENEEETRQIVTSDGPGNFGLLPNGVFCIRATRADVFETKRFVRENPNCTFATQSGPMLVIDGKLHPRFLEHSDSFYVRNGVGTSSDGKRAVFAISNERVNFHAFATLFRDALGVPQALYFDGNISRLYAPDLERFDAGFPMGPIVGSVVPNAD